MKVNFIDLANSILIKMKSRFGDSKLKDDYIYNQINKLIKEWESGNLVSTRTDIGVAAVRCFDSGSKEDIELVNDIATLADLYRRKARLSMSNKK